MPQENVSKHKPISLLTNALIDACVNCPNSHMPLLWLVKMVLGLLLLKLAPHVT